METLMANDGHLRTSSPGVQVYLQRDVCFSAFAVFDVDGDGRITLDELKQLLDCMISSNLGIHSPKIKHHCISLETRVHFDLAYFSIDPSI